LFNPKGLPKRVVIDQQSALLSLRDSRKRPCRPN
jgi:hypothetical protein